MRTTVTIDPDVELGLKGVMRDKDLSFKEALNAVLRRGLRAENERPASRFVQVSFDCGPLLVDPSTNLNHLAAELEDQEITAKLAQGR